MRVQDLDHAELLDLCREGEVRFAGQRMMLFDAVAVGLLRKHLVDNLGFTAAAMLLTRFGYAHGWRTAEAIHTQVHLESNAEWRGAGAALHALQGLFRVVEGSGEALSEEGLTVSASYEAEQYVVQFGRATVPVCTTVAGLISGYLSQSEGREILVVEDRCTARGDAACHFVARSREEWGDSHPIEVGYFDTTPLLDALPASMRALTASLKETERELRARRRLHRKADVTFQPPLGIVAVSDEMRRVVSMARRVAKVDTTVVITGESGVGKERIAQLIHQSSSRSGGPFLAINCGAITETLLESELFGHARGAFTGATHDRPGLFEAAHGGTLLLDEVGEISMGMQVKLLRVLQEREVRRVGENRNRRVDVRVLAATNRDLLELIEARTFRQDLYYRLNVVQIEVPPLRQRVDDILPLARLLLAEASEHLSREFSSFTPAVADQLVRYGWPGNVRELENAMHRAVVLARGDRVTLDDLPPEAREGSGRVVPMGGVVRPLKDVQKDYILAALALNDGNQSVTANQLEIGTATLYRKLKQYRETSTEAVEHTPEPGRRA